MSTFALVHGAWHGAWCWERLVPELEARGHRTVAMDLPSDRAEATFETYAGVVLDALAADRADDVVLVGHSLAGLTVPLVAAQRAVRHVVYLCALVPVPGRTFLDQSRTEDMLVPGYLDGLGEPDDQGARAWVDEALSRRTMYADLRRVHRGPAGTPLVVEGRGSPPPGR